MFQIVVDSGVSGVSFEFVCHTARQQRSMQTNVTKIIRCLVLRESEREKINISNTRKSRHLNHLTKPTTTKKKKTIPHQIIMDEIQAKANEEGTTATPLTSSSASVCPYAAALNWNSDSDSVTTTATTNSSNINHPDLFLGIGNSLLRTNHDTVEATVSPSTTTKQMIQSCPAFQNGHCPFASCTNEQEIRKMLLQIPSSHYLNNQIHQNSQEVKEEHHHHDDTEDDTVMNADMKNDANTTESDDDPMNPTTSTTIVTTPFLKVLQDLHTVAGTIATTSSSSSSAKIAIPKCPVFQMKTNTTRNATNTSITSSTTTSKFTHVIMDGYSLSEIMAQLAKQIEEEEEEDEENEPQGVPDGTTTSADTTASTADAAALVMEDNNDTIETARTVMSTEANPLISTLEKEEADVPVSPPADESPSTVNSDRKLSVTMKSGTAASHVAAENVYFVRNFIRGQIDPTLFAALTKQLYYVYRTLESYLLSYHPDHDTDENFQDIVHVQQFYKYHQALQRTESLKEDLDYWFGTKEAVSMIQYEFTTSNDDDHQFISPATMDYIRRIEYCAQHNPYLLLAHSYTRYLGDLSGGKILARVARKALQLSSTDGLAFYDFTTTIPNTKQFKDEYRMALDQLNPPLNHEQIQLLVAEANIAFVLNMRIFEELDVMANIPDAIVRPYDEAIRPYLDVKSSNSNSHSNTTETPHQDGNHNTTKEIPKECPFAKMNTVSTTTTTTNHRSNVSHPSTLTTTTTYPNSGKAQVARCPWPFIIFHDPKQALYDWQTWMVFGLVLCWLYHQLVLTALPH
jgi:heme oxygenase (biliverdin-producing, ferredoxin)